MMSILVKDPQDGLVKLYVKGADEVILQRMANT
jgi:magnesium-transporting ATPase (P-type)